MKRPVQQSAIHDSSFVNAFIYCQNSIISGTWKPSADHYDYEQHDDVLPKDIVVATAVVEKNNYESQ